MGLPPQDFTRHRIFLRCQWLDFFADFVRPGVQPHGGRTVHRYDRMINVPADSKQLRFIWMRSMGHFTTPQNLKEWHAVIAQTVNCPVHRQLSVKEVTRPDMRRIVTARLLPPVEARPRGLRHVFSDVVNDVS